MSIRAPFRLSLALLGLTSFAAPAIAHADAYRMAGGQHRVEEGLKVDKAARPAPKLPIFRKPGAHVETFITETAVSYQQNTRIDPINAELKSIPLGGKVEIAAVGEPKAITLPEGEMRRATGPAAVRKRENKAYNREVRKQIAMAQNLTTIHEVGSAEISKSADTNSAVPFSGKTVVLAGTPVTVAARTPLDVKVTDKFGRTQTVRTEAEGLKTVSSTSTYNNRTTTVTSSGLLAGTMKPPVQQANIRVSRPYVNIEGESMVKILSLGAFAGNNATVKVINRETGAEIPMTKISRAGGGSIEVPAMRKADLRLVVEYPAVAERSSASKTVLDFQAPDFASAKSGRHAAFEKVSFNTVE